MAANPAHRALRLPAALPRPLRGAQRPPPLLIVSDFKRFEVHTKFDSQRTRVYAFTLEELRLNKPVPTSALLPQDVLRHVFGDRNLLRPEALLLQE